MSDYETLLKNKQTELIRKALDGSVFLSTDLTPAGAIDALTQFSATATAGKVTGSAAAVAIVTGGNLVLSIDGAANVTTALAAADTPAGVVTKINTAIGAAGTAALAGSLLEITSTSTGITSSVQVVSGTGSVLDDLKLTAGQKGFGLAAGVSLKALAASYEDLGWLDTAGAQFSRDVATSEVNSWGSVSPTRTDVTSDTTTLSVTAQETKLLTIGMATGADVSELKAAFQTGEVSIAKPTRSKGRHYRALSLAVDQGDGGEIYLGRFLPRAKVTGYSEQAFGAGDDPVAWGVTMTGEEDSDLGYSERWFFGGPGWLALLAEMGIEQDIA